MALDPVLEKLLDDSGLTGDERASALAAFSNDNLGKTLKAATLRQSDYSRKMDELSAKWKVANDEYLKMQTDSAATIAERDEAKRKLEETEAKLATAQITPNIDTTKFLTTDQVEAREKKLAAGQMAWMGDVMEARDEYEALFGKKISQKEIMQKALAAGKSPLDYMEETYQMQAKRDEKSAADKVAHENSIREDERKKVTGEFLNPATRPLRDSDNPFWAPTGGEAKNPWDDTSPTQQETDLVAALANAGR